MSIEAAKLLVMIGAETEEARAAITTASQQMQTWGKDLMRTGAMMTAGITAPMVLVGKQALNMGIDYDQAMGVLRVSTGASKKEMDAFGKLAKELGSDLTLPGTSAGDAAEAMLELGRAGLDVNEIMTASRGVLEMSAAGQLSNAEAADITAKALNAFNLAGSEANRVADLFAAGANASSAEVRDIADAFKMSTAVFSAARVPIEDLTTEIALMSNAGIEGSDAGTSLKQMLLSLQSPSGKAAELMKKYEISVYDANKSLLPMANIIGQFSEKLGELTQEERNATLATIFGSDAVRAANVVLMGGVDAFQEMKVSVTEVGAAEKLAEAQMEGLSGASKALENAVETLMQDAISLFHEEIMGVTESIGGAVNAFTKLDDGTKKAALSIAGITGAAGPAIVALGGMMNMSAKLGSTLATLPTYLGEIGAGLSLIKSGSSVFEVMSLGSGAAAASLGVLTGGVALAAAAVGVLAVNWDNWFIEPSLELLEDTEEKLTDIYSLVEDKDESVSQVMGHYRRLVKEYHEELDKTNDVKELFIDKETISAKRAKETGKALQISSTSYQEYQKAMGEVAETEGFLINQKGDLINHTSDYMYATEGVIQSNYMLTESEWEEAKATQARKEAAEEVHALSGSLYEASVVEATVLRLQRQATLELAKAQKKLSDDLSLVENAYDLKLITFGKYTSYLELARQGVFDLTKEEEKSLEAAVTDAKYKQKIADAANELAEAVGKAKGEQIGLAQTFKGATEADYASMAIKNLTQEIERSGDPTGQLTATVEALGLKYGEMTESSIRASDAWPALNAAMEAGVVVGDNATQAMNLMNTQVETGKMKVEELFQSLGIAPEVYQPFIDSVKKTEMSLTGTTDATYDWDAAMNNIDTNLDGLSGSKMDDASDKISEVGNAMTTAATGEGGFVTFALTLQEIAENMGLFNEGLGKTPVLLEAFSGDDAANAIDGLKDIGEAMRDAASGEGGVKMLADGMESITGTLGVLGDENIIEGVSENLSNLGQSMSDVAIEGGGLSVFRGMMATIGESMITIAEKAASIQQTLPGFGQVMQQTAEQNLTPFRDMTSDIVLVGLTPIHNLLEKIHKTDLPKFDEALKVALEQYLKPFENKIIKLTNITIPNLINSFEDFIEIVETSRLKVVDLHNAIDALPSHKSITIDVVTKGELPGRQAGGPVLRGQPYIIGETGPELFIPAEYGRILSNRESREAIANLRRRSGDEAGGNVTNNNIQVTSLGDADSIGDSVMRAIQRLEMLYG